MDGRTQERVLGQHHQQGVQAPPEGVEVRRAPPVVVVGEEELYRHQVHSGWQLAGQGML